MNEVTATEETNLMVPMATGKAKSILNPTKTVITIEINIMMTWDCEIFGGHEDTAAVFGTDRVTEDTTIATSFPRLPLLGLLCSFTFSLSLLSLFGVSLRG